MSMIVSIGRLLLPIRKSPGLAISVIACRVSIAALTPLQALAIGAILDSLMTSAAGSGLTSAVAPLAGLFGILMVQYLLHMLDSVVGTRLSMKLDMILLPELASCINSLEYRHFENDDTYDLLERVCEDASGKVYSGFNNALGLASLAINIIGLVGIVAATSPFVALAAVAMMFPVVAIAKKSGDETYEADVLVAPRARMAKYLRSVLSSRETAAERTLFGYSESISKAWEEESDAKIHLSFQADRKIFLRSKAIAITFTAFVVAVALLLLWLVNSEAMSPGVCISLIIALSTAIHSLSWEFSDMLSKVSRYWLYLRDWDAVSRLEAVRDADARPSSGQSRPRFESLEFEAVSFAYPDSDVLVLRDFSLTMEQGRQYAFVGRNGCGKSTLVKVLSGLYPGYSGSIRLNGRDIESYDYAERKAAFSIVFQDFAKFQLPLRRQLDMACGSIDDGEIGRVLGLFGLTRKFSGCPRGFDVSLGKIDEDGIELSEGQWQRLAIARAFARPSPFFILDEPSSALDASAENRLYELIRERTTAMGTSTLYITHRLAAARLADEIIVMADGNVAEKGSHDALVAADGIYAGMFEAQARWYREKAEK